MCPSVSLFLKFLKIFLFFFFYSKNFLWYVSRVFVFNLSQLALWFLTVWIGFLECRFPTLPLLQSLSSQILALLTGGWKIDLSSVSQLFFLYLLFLYPFLLNSGEILGPGSNLLFMVSYYYSTCSLCSINRILGFQIF